ncbi:MAG: IgGFc-binding protein [Polyangiaceae bacterium]
MKGTWLALGAVVGSATLGVACSGASGGSGVNGGNGGTGSGGFGNFGNSGGSGAIIATGGGGNGGTPGVDPKTCQEAADAKSYVGCDFWPTPVTNPVWNLFDFAVVVANAGDQPANITVTKGGSPITTGVVQPNSLEKFYLPWDATLKPQEFDQCGSWDPPSLSSSIRSPQGAYNLTSSVPVTVYQFNALQYRGQGGPPGKNWSSCKGNQICPSLFDSIGCFSYSNDASLLLPSTAMTGNYRVTSQKGWAEASMPPYVAIVGTVDGTSVTVKASPTGAIAAGGGLQAAGANQSVQFSIGRGEVVEVFGTSTTDLAGTLVQASAPVQVIAGMPCTFQPFDINTPACDHLEESVFPAETLGKHYFVTLPTGPLGNTPGHIVRIVGNVDGTQLSYPGGTPPGAPGVLNAGQVADLGVVYGNFEISGDHEFAVASFQLGGSVVDPNAQIGSQKGDPAQSQMTAVEQYRTKYVFLAPDDYEVSYVDIVFPDGASITLDNAPLSAPGQPLSSGYSVARAKLGSGVNGAHVLISNVPVGIQVVGYGAYTSYQYPGGLNLSLIAPPPVK